mgnify:CR=1 FL=1
MLKLMRMIGMNSATMYLASFASIFLSIAVWFLQRGDDRSHAERFGIFIGLWAPTLMILGRSLEEAERRDDGKPAME